MHEYWGTKNINPVLEFLVPYGFSKMVTEMQNKTVLITGVTGHVGFRVMQFALDDGYHVRAVVRSEIKAAKVRQHPTVNIHVKEGRLNTGQ